MLEVGLRMPHRFILSFIELTDSFINSYIYIYIYLFIHSLIHSSFIPLCIQNLIIYLFSHLFIWSLVSYYSLINH